MSCQLLGRLRRGRMGWMDGWRLAAGRPPRRLCTETQDACSRAGADPHARGAHAHAQGVVCLIGRGPDGVLYGFNGVRGKRRLGSTWVCLHVT